MASFRGELWGLATTPTPDTSIEAAMEEATRGLMEIPGVSFIMVVGHGGSEFFKWYRTGLDRARMRVGGGDVIGLMGQAGLMLDKTSSGLLDSLVLRTDRSTILVQAAGRGYLVVVADKSVSLAILFMRARAVANDISKMLR
ncbi:hypothetical protein DRO32_01745 [Candidatus Bathyarchaeota archaeon]|nr:MAG: hypothetical protein DRO32_01745 [Candidatus Bathyarchaeota archaeon]